MNAFDCLIAVFWTVGRVDVLLEIMGLCTQNWYIVFDYYYLLNWSELFQWSDCGPKVIWVVRLTGIYRSVSDGPVCILVGTGGGERAN